MLTYCICYWIWDTKSFIQIPARVRLKKQNKMPWWHLKGQQRKKNPLHINEDDGIKHQTKARGETIAFMPLISAVLINLKHVIRDRRSSALQTLFIPQSSTFSSAQSSVSQRAQVWQGFPTCHLLRPRLHVHSTSICLKPFSLTSSEPAPTIALHSTQKLNKIIK